MSTAPPATHDLASLQARIAGKDGKLACVLLANSQPRLGTYVALARAIQEAGHIAVVIQPIGCAPAGEDLAGFESVEFASVPRAAIRTLPGVDVFFSSEVVFDVAPRRAATVGIFHSLPDQGLAKGRFSIDFAGYLRQKPTIIRSFDYFVAALRQGESEWDPERYSYMSGVYPPEFLRDRRPCLDIVPGGYPKLDYSRKLLESAEAPNCIIYSPTSTGSSLSRVQTDGSIVISALLESFPGWKIVFRPYPGKNDVELGRQLSEQFSAHPGFVLDETLTGAGYQRDCAVSITDSSSSAITFALARRRPLVFARLENEKPSHAATNPFGYTVDNVQALIEAVEGGLRDSARWAETIGEETARSIYNPGSASAYLAEHVGRFAARETHDDWLSVERKPWTGSEDTAEAERHLEHLRSQWPEGTGANATQMRDEIAAYIERRIEETETE